MKPQWIALPLLGVLILLLIGLAAGPLWVANITIPLRLEASNLTRTVASFGSWFGDVRKLSQDRDTLAKERNQLLSQVAQLQADKRESEAIKKEFNIDTKTSKSIIIAHAAGLSQQANTSYLLLDKGSLDGIAVGQVVLSDGALVGKIKNVASRSALVQLPLSLGNTVPVVIRHDQSITKGVVEGSFNLTAQLTQVLPTEELHQGDVIQTSADGGIYPPGIIVGKVGAIDKSANQVFQSASVELLWDINKIELVFVVK
jgi:rod shape-determining protein MreC